MIGKLIFAQKKDSRQLTQSIRYDCVSLEHAYRLCSPRRLAIPTAPSQKQLI